MLLTAKNTCLYEQNQEKTQCKVTGSYMVGQAQLMREEDIALARRVCGGGSARAVARMLSPIALIEIERNPTPEGFFPNSKDLETFAVEYVKVYRKI